MKCWDADLSKLCQSFRKEKYAVSVNHVSSLERQWTEHWEVTQWIKCLLCSRENVSVHPHPTEKLHYVPRICNPSTAWGVRGSGKIFHTATGPTYAHMDTPAHTERERTIQSKNKSMLWNLCMEIKCTPK